MKKVKSYAKINLFLRIVGKSEGYHELESLMARIDLHDVLEVAKSDKFSIAIDGEFSGAVCVQDNLLTRILDYFVENFSISRDLEIKLTKNIPVGGGLGGGSSNAAVFMEILNEIFAIGLKKEELQDISMKFGSDIAFFFEKSAAIIRGRGKIVEKFDNFEPFEALLVNPGVNLSTKDVFSEFKGNFSQKTEDFSGKSVLGLMDEFDNDLEAAAIRKCPKIADILQKMREQGAKIARMSGSGASCFGVFEDLDVINGFNEVFVRKIRVF